MTMSIFPWDEAGSELAESVGRLVGDKLRQGAEHDAEALWTEIAGLGWLAIGVPEEHGGIGGSGSGRLTVMEGLASLPAALPYLSSGVVAAELILSAGSQEQKAALLPEIVAGTRIGAFGSLEPLSRGETGIEARETDGGFMLAGREALVVDAPRADFVIVRAWCSGGAVEGPALFMVPARGDGIVRCDYETVDGHGCSDFDIAALALPAGSRLGDVGAADGHCAAALHHGMLAASAMAVGTMRRLNAVTAAHLNTRQQFGRPLAKFQALRHQMADMVSAYEEAASLLARAAQAFFGGAADADRLVLAAKIHTADAGRLVAERAVQLHGGMGMSEETGVGRLFRSLLAHEFALGTTEDLTRRFAAMTQAHAA